MIFLIVSDTGNWSVLMLLDRSAAFDHNMLLNRVKLMPGTSGSALDCLFLH